MKNIFNLLATILIAVGIILIAGAGNDCDGKCMEQANTISEMLMYAFKFFYYWCISFNKQ